ncbi:MAG: xanthan lyase [Chlorobiota bacterium]
MRSIITVTLFLFLFLVPAVFPQQADAEKIAGFRQKLAKELRANHKNYNLSPSTKIDTVYTNSGNELVIGLNRRSSGNVIREDNVSMMTQKFTDFKNENGFANYGLRIFMGAFELAEMVPNYFREDMDQDSRRLPLKNEITRLVTRNDRPFKIEKGLDGRNIALWNSHGWYYSHEDDRWQWQRARLWGTVEDLLTSSMVLQYLVPMLENAGAGVFLPRERDIQWREAVVDPEARNNGEGVENFSKWEKAGIGFGYQLTYSANLNPFHQGSFLKKAAVSKEESPLVYTPTIPETGEYAVYVSYGKDPDGKNISNALYTVRHAGGTTSFTVDQTRGWATWIYLGTFKFYKGNDPGMGAVTVSDRSNSTGVVTSDAVRFGGGVGVVVRNGVSGRPRFTEAARYYLQYIGAPDTLVYSHRKDTDDYVDDYSSRGEFVNWLNGAPGGPNKKRDIEGLHIPVDLSMAWHTDAGILGADSTVGTLMIYSSVGTDTSFFPNGRSRMANRDLADIVQTQIAEDIQKLFDRKWTRREMWDANYSEAVRPNVPGILLELLSHQNFAEMKFFWQPGFKFNVSRAIYKGMLRFMASMHGTDYAVQPLPVHSFQARLDNNDAVLAWSPAVDPLESTANPEGYIVYRRIGEGGFDNGRFTSDDFYIDSNIPVGQVVSYKVTAVNSGGESFPSEVLAVGIGKNCEKEVLIVNAFDRLDAPATVVEKGYEGFLFGVDEGVQYGKNIAYIGEQVDYDRKSDFKSNDAPGFGATRSNLEGKVIAGNTFDFTAIHGAAVLDAGFSFSSVSDEIFEKDWYKVDRYSMIDLIAGEEKSTTVKLGLDPVVREDFRLFTPGMIRKLDSCFSAGKALFLSGSYIGTELEHDTVTAKFGVETLKVKLGTKFATTGGDLIISDKFGDTHTDRFRFNTAHSEDIYRVEAPQALNPEKDGETLARYAENTNSAIVGYRGTHRSVVASFPFETLLTPEQRNEFMKLVLRYLGM